MTNIIRSNQSFSILLLSLVFLIASIWLDLIDYHHNMIVLILNYIILVELSKLIIEMIIQPDAPIKIRYILAGLVVASAIEFRIFLVDHNLKWALYSLAAIAILLALRHYAIFSTKEGR